MIIVMLYHYMGTSIGIYARQQWKWPLLLVCCTVRCRAMLVIDLATGLYLHQACSLGPFDKHLHLMMLLLFLNTRLILVKPIYLIVVLHSTLHSSSYVFIAMPVNRLRSSLRTFFFLCSWLRWKREEKFATTVIPKAPWEKGYPIVFEWRASTAIRARAFIVWNFSLLLRIGRLLSSQLFLLCFESQSVTILHFFHFRSQRIRGRSLKNIISQYIYLCVMSSLKKIPINCNIRRAHNHYYYCMLDARCKYKRSHFDLPFTFWVQSIF